jgi:predicted RNase H-like HicB family nuclease
MLQDYISTYVKKAKYERIDGGKRVYAEIKELRGVWATGKSKEECRKNLTSVLEGWIIFRLRRNLPIPNFKIPSFPIQVRAYA